MRIYRCFVACEYMQFKQARYILHNTRTSRLCQFSGILSGTQCSTTCFPSVSLSLSPRSSERLHTKIDTLPGSLPEFSLCETHRDPSASRIVLIASKFVRCEITNNDSRHSRIERESRD